MTSIDSAPAPLADAPSPDNANGLARDLAAVGDGAPASAGAKHGEALEPAQAEGAVEPVHAGDPPAAEADAGPRLRKLFPLLFGHPAKPLKLQIQHDIQARAPGAFSKKALSAFFRRYTGSHAYLNAVAHAKSRFDLDGQPAGELSAEHRDAAAQELARRRANQNARQELEEQQRRNRATLLHDFQTTTLTPANFCALKGVPIDELDGLLAVAKGESDERGRLARAPSPQRDIAGRGPRGADERGPQGRRGPGGRPPTDARRR